METDNLYSSETIGELNRGDLKVFKSVEDDCVYFYDPRTKRYKKVCDVMEFRDLPASVKKQIKIAKEEAVELLRIPTE